MEPLGPFHPGLTSLGGTGALEGLRGVPSRAGRAALLHHRFVESGVGDWAEAGGLYVYRLVTALCHDVNPSCLLVSTLCLDLMYITISDVLRFGN